MSGKLSLGWIDEKVSEIEPTLKPRVEAVEKCYRCKVTPATAHYYGQNQYPVCDHCYKALDEEFDREMDGGS